jgi:hypothetical protein
MAIAFLLNTKSEIFKTKRTLAFWLTIIGAVVIPLVLSLGYNIYAKEFAEDLKLDPWSKHMNNVWQGAAALLLPMYVILVTSLVVQIEYRNNTWKQVYASPRTYADVYFSKFLVINMMIISCFILFNLLIILSGYITGLIHPDVFSFNREPIPLAKMFRFSAKLYMSILAISAIQYWLSLRFKNFIAAIGIGLALFIAGLLVIEWPKSVYNPYVYTALTYFKDLRKGITGTSEHELYSLIWFGAVLILGFVDTVKRKERG